MAWSAVMVWSERGSKAAAIFNTKMKAGVAGPKSEQLLAEYLVWLEYLCDKTQKRIERHRREQSDIEENRATQIRVVLGSGTCTGGSRKGDSGGWISTGTLKKQKVGTLQYLR